MLINAISEKHNFMDTLCIYAAYDTSFKPQGQVRLTRLDREWCQLVQIRSVSVLGDTVSI